MGKRNYRDSHRCAKCEEWFLKSNFDGKIHCPCCGDRLRSSKRYKRSYDTQHCKRI